LAPAPYGGDDFVRISGPSERLGSPIVTSPSFSVSLGWGLCGDPFLIAKPFFLEGQWAELAQRIACSRSTFNEPNNVSPTALSQQSPLRLIEPRVLKTASCFCRRRIYRQRLRIVSPGVV